MQIRFHSFPGLGGRLPAGTRNQIAPAAWLHASVIPDDFFIFDPATRELTGRHMRRVIRLGDNLVMQIYKVDSFKKQVEFMLVPSHDRPARQDRSVRQERRGPPDRGPRQTAAPRKPGHGRNRAQKRK